MDSEPLEKFYYFSADFLKLIIFYRHAATGATVSIARHYHTRACDYAAADTAVAERVLSAYTAAVRIYIVISSDRLLAYRAGQSALAVDVKAEKIAHGSREFYQLSRLYCGERLIHDLLQRLSFIESICSSNSLCLRLSVESTDSLRCISSCSSGCDVLRLVMLPSISAIDLS